MICHSDPDRIDRYGLPSGTVHEELTVSRLVKQKELTEEEQELCDKWIERRTAVIRGLKAKMAHMPADDLMGYIRRELGWPGPHVRSKHYEGPVEGWVELMLDAGWTEHDIRAQFQLTKGELAAILDSLKTQEVTHESLCED